MKRVLVVDDNEANIHLIRFILEKNGVEVIEARSGAEGVELAVQEKPDLVLMDIQLPDIDGLEATKRIRGRLTVTFPLSRLLPTPCPVIERDS